MTADEEATTEVVVITPQEVAPLAALSAEQFRHRLEQAKLNVERMTQIQREVMSEGSDYGVIPGTQKPTLLQPGAQLLNKMANLSPTFEVERTCSDGETAPTIDFRVKCTLTARDGAVWEGLGSCNSWEPRYRWRKGDRRCPACGSESIREARRDDPKQAFYCWRKVGGCGLSWDRDTAEAKAMAAQSVERTENADPWGLDNTLLKIASKRALVHATTLAHACSRIFTQDVEDSQVSAEPAQTSAREALGAQHGGALDPAAPLSKASIEKIERGCRNRLKLLVEDEENWAAMATGIVRDLGHQDAGATPEAELPLILRAISTWNPSKAAAAGSFEGEENVDQRPTVDEGQRRLLFARAAELFPNRNSYQLIHEVIEPLGFKHMSEIHMERLDDVLERLKDMAAVTAEPGPFE